MTVRLAAAMGLGSLCQGMPRAHARMQAQSRQDVYSGQQSSNKKKTRKQTARTTPRTGDRRTRSRRARRSIGRRTALPYKISCVSFPASQLQSKGTQTGKLTKSYIEMGFIFPGSFAIAMLLWGAAFAADLTCQDLLSVRSSIEVGGPWVRINTKAL